MALAAISIGSNMGDSKKNVALALTELITLKGCMLISASRLYRTEPVDVTDQPWFVNAAVVLNTQIKPFHLLKELQALEKKFGRKRVIDKGPRTLDLDLLLYGKRIVEGQDLILPHPRVHERRFVLEPLAEIAPEMVHPVSGKTIANLLKSCPDKSVVRRLDSTDTC